MFDFINNMLAIYTNEKVWFFQACVVAWTNITVVTFSSWLANYLKIESEVSSLLGVTHTTNVMETLGAVMEGDVQNDG